MNDAERRVAERLAMAEGVAPPSLAREQERTGQRREALAALAGTLAAFWSLEEAEAYVRSTEDLNWDYVRGLAASAVAAAIRAQAPPP